MQADVLDGNGRLVRSVEYGGVRRRWDRSGRPVRSRIPIRRGGGGAPRNLPVREEGERCLSPGYESRCGKSQCSDESLGIIGINRQVLLDAGNTEPCRTSRQIIVRKEVLRATIDVAHIHQGAIGEMPE